MNDATRTEIERLRPLKITALRLRYRELFGEDSEASSHSHLLRRIGWKLQAIAEGDLTDRARSRAAELIADADLRLNSRRKVWRIADVQAATAHHDLRVPTLGTVVQREFQGRLISAKVLQAGFEYDGRKFDSLSAIAYEVSGTRWNGFEFFRLNKQPTHD